MTATFTIATKFLELTTFELEEWLWVGTTSLEEERAICKELATRAKRRQAMEDFLW